MDEFGFDLAAASLSADSAQINGAVDALAVRLEAALPNACEVERPRRLRGRRHVRRIVVALGDKRFVLRIHHGLQAEIESAIHDMRTRVDKLAIDEWLEALSGELRVQAASSADAKRALDDLLIG